MANTKVYYITLRVSLIALKKYIQRYQVQLQANLGEAQYNCVMATLDAIIACILILPGNPYYD